MRKKTRNVKALIEAKLFVVSGLGLVLGLMTSGFVLVKIGLVASKMFTA